MSDPVTQRVQEAATKLRDLDERSKSERTSEWLPAWSSLALERVVKEVVSKPDGQLSDLFMALWGLLSAPGATLTKTMANFIQDIVVLCFTRYRKQYEAEDFKWMCAQMKQHCTATQAYFSLLALPGPIAIEYKGFILAALEPTEFIMKAQQMLSAS